MRVLMINWVDVADRTGRGGGVRHYEQGLLRAAAARKDLTIATLAAGLVHSLKPQRPRIVRLPDAPDLSVPRWQLVDSGVLAPAHADFGNPAQISHPETEAAFARFLAETGPWDVVHFNNLEGLPARVLLHARAHAKRVVLMLHNYYPFCPLQPLWRNESLLCTDFEGGAACVRCLPVQPNRSVIRLAYALEAQFGRTAFGAWVYERALRPALAGGWRRVRKLAGRRHAQRAAQEPHAKHDRAGQENRSCAFAHRRAEMIALLTQSCDRVLCVSERVRKIALGFGLDPTRTLTCRIGTPEAEAWARTKPHASFLKPDGTLTLAYLGYMRADKGYGFLLSALAALPDGVLSRVRLKIAALPGPAEDPAALDRLTPRLAQLIVQRGYKRSALDALLADVDLGVIPVLWEDNLPQVALEMHARHIPLLCSDRGGAAELQNCPALVFRAGDRADFARALSHVLDGRLTPSDAFAAARAPLSPDQHLEELMGHWRGAGGN